MKTTRGCSSCDGGTLQKQAMPMDLDVYWCDGSVRERWKQDVPSTITRSISGLDSQNRSRTKDLVISIINNQHPLKRRTTKEGLERMTHSGPKPGIPVSKTVIPVFVPGTVRAGGRFLGRKTPKSIATQTVCPGRSDDSGVIKARRSRLERDHSLVRDVPRADRLLCLPGADCAHSGIWSDRRGVGGPPFLHRYCGEIHNPLGEVVDVAVGRGRERNPKGMPHVPHGPRLPHCSQCLVGARQLDLSGRPKVDRGAIATRFFDVLTARIFQEKKP